MGHFDRYTFHIEPVEGQVAKICRQVREAGMKVGLALKPGTEVEVVKEFIPMADMILIMTVEPGTRVMSILICSDEF